MLTPVEDPPSTDDILCSSTPPRSWLAFLVDSSRWPDLVTAVPGLATVAEHEIDAMLGSAWEDRAAPRLFPTSILSAEEQATIVRCLPADLQSLAELRRQTLDLAHSNAGAAPPRSLTRPAWWSVDTDRSAWGWRLQVGFYNRGCQWWRRGRDRIGCLNCGYFISTSPRRNPTPDEYVAQLRAAVTAAGSSGAPRFDVLELNSDGSFLADDEIGPAARKQLLAYIASLSDIRSLHVESRPEHVSEAAVARVLEQLRPDQRLTVGIGLETVDPFIGTLCIRKGFGLDDFRDAAHEISEAGGDRVAVRCYTLIKPAYLSEDQAFRDALATATAMADVANEGIRVEVKFEPTVLARGTLLDVLAGQQQHPLSYVPPSTWSVMELLLALSDSPCTFLVGAREDMDHFSAIPAARHADGRMSLADVDLYDSLQQYNRHGEPQRLDAMARRHLGDDSFARWCSAVPSARVLWEAARDARDDSCQDEDERTPMLAWARGINEAFTAAWTGASGTTPERLEADLLRRFEVSAPGTDVAVAAHLTCDGACCIMHWRARPDGVPLLDAWLEVLLEKE